MTAARYAEITADQARGNSRPVTSAEFQTLAATGHAMLEQRTTDRAPADGLDAAWSDLVTAAFTATRTPWGGITVSAQAGVPLETDADRYALSVKPADHDSVSVPATADAVALATAMRVARERFAAQLEMDGAHLGVFRDEDHDRIDVDPVLIVDTPAEVEAIGAATLAVGGAYHFATGDGYWPPHVA